MFNIDLSSPILLAVLTIISAIVLLFCDKRAVENKSITMKDGLFVGLAQLASIFPGVSRLGACLSMMRYLNYSREDSFRFSILLSLPPVAGACFLKMLKILSGKIIIEDWSLVAIGCLFSLICGLCSLIIVNEFFKKHTMLSIVVYRIIFGIFVAIYSNANWPS